MYLPNKVIIVNYGLGNLYSVLNACDHVGLNAIVSDNEQEINNADGLILPGVGSFGEAMKNLHSKGLVKAILKFSTTKKPILGICLGMQLLFDESEEFGIHKGLGVLSGKVVKFPTENEGKKLLLPQIAWNRVYKPTHCEWCNTPLEGISTGEFMYFVHGYFIKPTDNRTVLAETNYGGFNYCSAAKKNNVFGVQFHPEKSAKSGLKIYDNFKKIIYGT